MGLEAGQQLVNAHYAAQKKSAESGDCAVETDYRQVIERDDLDAVVVATPDHWHAQITLDAMSRGLDVYCEKPVTHFFAEGQKVYKTAAAQNVVFQVGSQQRSDPLFRKAVEIVRNGHLGAIKRVEVGLPPGYAKANDDTSSASLPTGLDYDMWCGPAPKLPYARAWHHRWWRGVRAYGGGVLMDWIGHHNDIAHWGLEQSLGGPLRVEAVGWSPSQCPQYDTPADFEIQCSYAEGVESIISSSNRIAQGTKWIGDEGWLWVNRGKLEASERRWLANSFVAGEWRAAPSPGHVSNFVECVKSRQNCVTSAEIGHRSITPGHLGYVSHQLGRPLTWNAKTEHVVGDETAQSLLMSVQYRAPWSFRPQSDVDSDV
jgi:predicted dehydrogenase